MGFIKDAKANQMAIEARDRRAKGGRIFFARLNFPGTHHALSGGIDDFAMMIEAIEGQGWALANMSMGEDKKGRPEGYFLFRVQ